MSVDDSVLDKLYSNPEHAALIDYYWSGKHHRAVKGINLVTLFYTDVNGVCLPVNYRIYDKSLDKTKNDYFREMLTEVISWGLKPWIVTGDTWYSGLMNLKHVRFGSAFETLQSKLKLATRIFEQKRDSKDKVYSLHEPDTSCIAKGKAHKKYEYGSKVGLISTMKSSFIIAIEAFQRNPYDGKIIAATGRKQYWNKNSDRCFG